MPWILRQFFKVTTDIKCIALTNLMLVIQSAFREIWHLNTIQVILHNPTNHPAWYYTFALSYTNLSSIYYIYIYINLRVIPLPQVLLNSTHLDQVTHMYVSNKPIIGTYNVLSSVPSHDLDKCSITNWTPLSEFHVNQDITIIVSELVQRCVW